MFYPWCLTSNLRLWQNNSRSRTSPVNIWGTDWLEQARERAEHDGRLREIGCGGVWGSYTTPSSAPYGAVYPHLGLVCAGPWCPPDCPGCCWTLTGWWVRKNKLFYKVKKPLLCVPACDPQVTPGPLLILLSCPLFYIRASLASVPSYLATDKNGISAFLLKAARLCLRFFDYWYKHENVSSWKKRALTFWGTIMGIDPLPLGLESAASNPEVFKLDRLILLLL